MNYLDLFQYGKTDIQRAENAFKNGDYPITGFFLQQALEKHLKAYLLKNEIVHNIKNLGHLQMPKIIDEMIIYAKKINLDPPTDYVKLSWGALENLHELLEFIESNEVAKIAIWKESLALSLNKHESNLFQGKFTKFLKNVDEFYEQSNVVSSDYQSAIDKIGIDKIDTSKLTEREKAGLEFLQHLPNLFSMENPEKTMEIMNKVMNNFGWGSGGKTLSRDLTQNMTKYLKLCKCMDWIDIIALTYPHQEISRYPFQIDEKISDEIYLEQKDNLKKMLDNVKNTCKQIEQN